jgi:Xaa-Pro aminopeptidase
MAMSLSVLPKSSLMEIVHEKHKQLPSILKINKIDCWITFVRETSLNPDPVISLVVGNDVVWESAFIFAFEANTFRKIAIVGNFDAPAEKQKEIWDEVIPYKEGISEHLSRVINRINPQTIALNYSIDDVASDGLSHGLFIKLSEILEDKREKFVSAKKIINMLRGKKTKREVELITEACQLTEEINRKITSQLKLGMSEIEIQQLFHEEMDKLGVSEAWQRESCPAIDAGPDKELGHIGPSYYVTKKGHTLHNDFGIKYYGYCSDLQRMWFFGIEEDIPDELIHAFETVRQAIIKAKEFIKPGVLGYAVDQVARDFVVSQGYKEYDHALGHQIGRQAHDGGVLLGPLWERYGNTPKGVIEEGNVFTLELHVKTENFGTVSLEENIIITKNGSEFLVPPQEKFIMIK